VWREGVGARQRAEKGWDAAAGTYRRLLAHFAPSFLLGLTATPDRTDQSDILAHLRVLLLALIVLGRYAAHTVEAVWHAMVATLGVAVRVPPAARPGRTCCSGRTKEHPRRQSGTQPHDAGDVPRARGSPTGARSPSWRA
jgi:hypothetical protein